MRNLLGVLMILAGIALGLYVGLWLCFIGGIIDVIEEVRAEEIDAMNVAIGIVKIIFASFAGWLSALALVIPGVSIANNR